MTALNLHELANSGGFGSAGRTLDMLGHRAERKPGEGNAWIVTMEYSVNYVQEVEVEAATASEAKRLAREEATRDPELGDFEGIEFYKTEVEEADK